MGNIFDLKEGMLFSIKLNENAWTLGQFCNVFRLEGRRYAQIRLTRSEERRVGKECRSRWSPYH